MFWGKLGEVHESELQLADWKCFAWDKSVRDHVTSIWIDPI